jgi:hypothetical protein
LKTLNDFHIQLIDYNWRRGRARVSNQKDRQRPFRRIVINSAALRDRSSDFNVDRPGLLEDFVSLYRLFPNLLSSEAGIGWDKANFRYSKASLSCSKAGVQRRTADLL